MMIRFLLCGALLAAATTGQRTWKVQCNGGPGIDFTDLPPAVAAAAPGDTILVWYNASLCPAQYTAPIVDKPLSIVGFNTGGAIGSNPTTCGMLGLLTITGIPAGQRCTISNMSAFTTFPVGALPQPASGFLIRDCAGDVLLEDIYCYGVGVGGPTFQIERCANVTLRRCEIYVEGSPIEVVDSNVLGSFLAVWHERTIWSPTIPTYAQGAPGMSLLRSNVTLASSLVEGMWTFAFGSSPARPGIILEQSTLRVGPGTLVRGGMVGGGPTGAYFAANPSTSSIYLDPRGSLDYFDVPTGPAPIPTEINSTIHHSVVAGQNYNVGTCGPLNGHALLILGDLAPAPVPTSYGLLAIHPPTAIFVRFSPLNAQNGCELWTYPCPITAPVGYAFAYQALTLSPSGAFGLTLPSPVTVGWPHGQVP